MLEDHGYDGEEDDDEIEDVPAVLEVSLFSKVEAHYDYFDDALDDEAPGDDVQHQL